MRRDPWLVRNKRWACSVGIVTVGAALLLGVGIWQQVEANHRDEILQKGERGSAEIVSVYHRRGSKGGKTATRITLTITSGSGAGQEVRTRVSQSTALERGDSVRVAYLRTNPRDLVIIGEQSQLEHDLPLYAVGIPVGTVIALWVYRRRSGRNLPERSRWPGIVGP